MVMFCDAPSRWPNSCVKKQTRLGKAIITMFFFYFLDDGFSMVFPWFSNGFSHGFPTGLPAFRASGTGEGDRAAFDLAFPRSPVVTQSFFGSLNTWERFQKAIKLNI